MIEQIVDTNILLFFLQNDRRLPSRAADLIEDSNRLSLVSIASLWEISIKTSLGKLNYSPATTLEFPKELVKQGFEIAPLSWQVMCQASKLPWHHRDPFDRYLIAEAQNRNAPILSTDDQLDAYEVERIR
ncbi:type II toxin-antitoxin system VapC family toxin [Opitutales bacterium]|nr:type II toxin-antitoxin system VapC family toxin [Opitutales bacterium]